MGKSEKRFNDILSTVTNAKNDRFKTSAGGREITLDNTERLLRDLGNGILDDDEYQIALKESTAILLMIQKKL